MNLHPTPYDPFGRNDEIEAPTIASWAVRCLLELAQAEGVSVWNVHELILSDKLDPEDIAKCPLHFPRIPALVVDPKRSWPVFRWQLAVGLGLHYHLDRFEVGVHSRKNLEAAAYERANQWANGFLSSFAAKWCLSGRKLETWSLNDKGVINCFQDVADANRKNRPAPTSQPDRSTPVQRLHFRLGTCKGFKADGKPCRGRRSPGSDFCRHHQGTELPTLEDIVAEQNWERPVE